MPSANVLFAGIVAGSVFLLGGAGVSRAAGRAPASPLAKVTIDYPLDGSVFPPEITPPTFLWRDDSEAATRWVVEVSFAGRADGIRVEAPGEHIQRGEIDPRLGASSELPPLTPQQAATRTWRPDAETWAKVKRWSARSPATVVITGFAADDPPVLPVSSGRVTLSTSPDAVGAPVLYRDVPVMVSPPGERGAIQPLPPFAIPLIKWQLRNIGEPRSLTVMENVPTCANCHSFSRDGKTLGLDLDGPANDKGLYALVPMVKNTTIRKQDVIRWTSFMEDPEARSTEPAVARVGFMSQVSPGGRYVVTTIGPPPVGNTHEKENPDASGAEDRSGGVQTTRVQGLAGRLFSSTYNDVTFSQVFYPTRGILAWYDRQEKKMRPLPGADDPRFVQTGAFWSPDGKYLIFSRAEARDPYPPGAKRPQYANDPNELQIQYDLYRIPFDEGRGGKAEPVAGASGNGMSNNFPKVSPDGRWIVFVQNRNGLLMRPDSKLYIVPFAGGRARLMGCNTSLMNSWHTFSPNGRWLAFSSKSRSPYTQLLLTHIDARGNDTPPILVENTAAANRGVNIPEFVNVPSDGLEKIDPQATEVYRSLNRAYELVGNNQVAEAVQELRKAVEQEPDDGLVHYALAMQLSRSQNEPEAVEEYRRACALDPSHAAWFAYFAVSLARTGDIDGAVVNSRKALALEPSAGAEAQLGTLLAESGQAQEAYEHLRKAVEMAPDFPLAHFRLGLVLAKMERLDDAVIELQQAVALVPTSVEYRLDLGLLMGRRGDFSGAAAAFEKAVELSEGRSWQPLVALADAYDKTGRSAEAVQAARRALDLALQEHDEALEKSVRDVLARYERVGTRASP